MTGFGTRFQAHRSRCASSIKMERLCTSIGVIAADIATKSTERSSLGATPVPHNSGFCADPRHTPASGCVRCRHPAERASGRLVRVTARERRSSADLRDLIIRAGLTLLYQRGLRTTADHVPLTEALAQLSETHGIDVSMGSIFGANRIWADKREFQVALLEAAIVDRDTDGPTDMSRTLVGSLPDIREESFEQRIGAMVELCRTVGQVNGYVDDIGKNRSWAIWVSIWATAVADPDSGERLIPLLRSGEERTIEDFGVLYAAIFERLGLRLKAGYTVTQFATLAAALTDGVALRAAVAPERVKATSPRAGDWNLLGTGFVAISLEYLEADD